EGGFAGWAARGLIGEVRLEDRLIFGRQRRLLARSGRLMRIVLDATVHAARHGDAAPLALQVRIFGVIERLRADGRQKCRRQGREEGKMPKAHACSPCVLDGCRRQQYRSAGIRHVSTKGHLMKFTLYDVGAEARYADPEVGQGGSAYGPRTRSTQGFGFAS